jgi:UDP-glucuronate 4-epimerase
VAEEDILFFRDENGVRLMQSAVLITGAAGFIGSHLTERLLSNGGEVVGLDNFDDYYAPAIKRDNIRAVGSGGRFHMVEGDIRDADLIKRIIEEYNIERVAHLAARAGVRPSMRQPMLYQDVNIGGTINLLEACRTHGVKQFLFTSSSSVYGSGASLPFREEAKLDSPGSPYAASKLAAELFCRTYHHLYGLPVTIIRPFTVYGPRQRPEMAISLFTRQIDAGEKISIFGDGTSKRDYTHVSDIVDGMEKALTLDKAGFEIFNLGDARPVTLHALVNIIEKALGKEARIKYLPAQDGDMPVTYADISKAGKYLGYKPKVTIEDGIARFVAWQRQSGNTARLRSV